MIARRIASTIAGVALVGALGGGAIALANGDDQVSPTTPPTTSPTVSPTTPPTTSPTVSPTTPPTTSPTASPTASPTTSSTAPGLDDDGTADQGHGDAPGTAGSFDDDGDHDDDGTTDQGHGDSSGHGSGDDDSGSGGDSGRG